MSSLSAADVRAVLALVGDMHDAESLDDFRAGILPALRRLVACDHASYNEVAENGEVLAALVEPELPADALELWSRHALGNPLVARFARTRDGRAYRFSDVMAPDELARLPAYRDFFLPLGLPHQVAFALPSPPGVVRGIALTRGGRDFTTRDREMLDLARPHLVQAYRNAVLRGRLEGVTGALSATLERLGDPAAVVGARGDVAYATPAARAILAELDGAVGRPLPAVLRGARPEVSRPLVVTTPRGAIAVRALAAGGAEHVLVFESDAAPDVAALRGLGLTAREAEVLRAFATGASSAAVAAELGISVRTVHKHAQRIHAKLGTHERGEAVATALAAVRTGT